MNQKINSCMKTTIYVFHTTAEEKKNLKIVLFKVLSFSQKFNGSAFFNRLCENVSFQMKCTSNSSRLNKISKFLLLLGFGWIYPKTVVVEIRRSSCLMNFGTGTLLFEFQLHWIQWRSQIWWFLVVQQFHFDFWMPSCYMIHVSLQSKLTSSVLISFSGY